MYEISPHLSSTSFISSFDAVFSFLHLLFLLLYNIVVVVVGEILSQSLVLSILAQTVSRKYFYPRVVALGTSACSCLVLYDADLMFVELVLLLLLLLLRR